ncbi:MAG: SGNH/GDSL hydrolase family protein [Aureliella sp.]
MHSRTDLLTLCFFTALSIVTVVPTQFALGFQDAQESSEKPTAAKQKKPKAAKKPRANPAMAKVEDVEGLPRILLIGDSISIGYTVPVRKALAGKANVHRPLTNCGPTTKGVAELEKWLGKGKWDVIHFNFGLHDLKYMGPNGENLANPKDAKSHQQVPPEEYRDNLESIVQRLKKTGAKLIWRNTTPVPAGAKGRVVGDSKEYNKIAAEVMKEHSIPTDDHYSFAMTKMKEIQLPANVHFTKDGSQALAARVVDSLTRALPELGK